MEFLGLYLVIAAIVFSFSWIEELHTVQHSIKSAILWPINLIKILFNK
jgi:hypothetical protein